ncbi:SH3 domain-containing protein [Streptomyces sp. NPDC051018]|uniref:SH3 domain-containing protein n=1 Tax=Streptomyces sp. NPDC051018 TaxID=3365639 RepID=UPI00378CDF8D
MALDDVRPDNDDSAATGTESDTSTDSGPDTTAEATTAAAAPTSAGSAAEADGEESAGAEAAARVRRYPVAPGYRLNVRSGPGTGYGIVRVLPLGATVPIYCQRPGETITGPYGTSLIWDNIASGEYVSDAYVNTGSDGYVTIRCP